MWYPSPTSGLEFAGDWELNPQFMSVYARFWVKVGFKFQSLCKISNISTSDPLPFFYVSSNTAALSHPMAKHAAPRLQGSMSRKWLLKECVVFLPEVILNVGDLYSDGVKVVWEKGQRSFKGNNLPARATCILRAFALCQYRSSSLLQSV